MIVKLKRVQGFTLVEMLVSMVLLSMILLVASSAYSMFSDRWNGRLGKFNKTLQHTKQLILVQESLKSIVSYVVVNDKNQPKLFFEGNRNGFVAVSLSSIFEPDKAVIMRLQAIQNPDFSYRLEYQEALMSEQLLTHSNQNIVFGSPVILFDQLPSIEFEYLGWPAAEIKRRFIDNPSSTLDQLAWNNSYNGLITNLQPEQVRITFFAQGHDYALQVKLNDLTPGVLNDYTNIDQ